MKKFFLIILFLVTLAFSNVIELNYKDSRVVRVPGIEKAIVFENQGNISVSLNEEMLLIKGLNPGSSKIILVKETGKDIMIVKVNPRPLESEQKISNVDYSGKKFVSNFTAGYGRGDSKSDFAENNWNYHYMYYKLDTKGQTPWGGFYGRIGIKNKPEFRGVYDFNARLDSEVGIFELGDQFVYGKSSIVMPSQPLQGLSWTNKYTDLETFLFFGRNNFGYWGSVLEREDMRGYQNLAYAKLLYNIDSQNQLGVNLSNKSASLLYDWSKRNYNFYGEIGKDNNNKSAQDIKFTYYPYAGINGSVRYLSVEEGFLTPVGIENYAGYTGFKYNLYYRPNLIWDVAYNGETFLNSVNSEKLFNQRDYFMGNYKASKVNDVLPDIFFDYSNYRSEAFRVTQNNYEYQNKSFQLKLTKEVNPFSLWYKFRPYYYEDLRASAENYDKIQHSVGFKVPLVNPFTYQFEVTSRKYSYKVASNNYNELEYDNFLIMNPIMFANGDMSIDGFYQLQTRFKDSNSEWKILHYYMLQYLWYLNPDGHLAVRGYRRVNNEDNSLRQDSVLDELRIEYSQNFDYSLRLGGGKSIITGIVFKDENMNGIYDEGESGESNVNVALSSGVSTTTNRLGVYTFRDIPVGDYDVYVTKENSDIVYTYDYPRRIVIDNSQRVLANFGVLISGKIHGRIFADLNENGIFDANDKPLPEVRVFINNDVVKSDADGFYSYSADDFSNYTVKVGIASAPFSFSLTSPRVVNLEGKGSANFIFRPRKDIQALDNQVRLIDIKEYGDDIFIEGEVVDQVVSLFINDQQVPIYGSKFRITVKKIADKLKVKIFTKDKRSYIQRIEYQ